MNPFKPKNTKKAGPERIIQDALKVMLKGRDWLVMETHGNEFQFGFPDLYCAHLRYGSRWIEVKNPKNYSFTKAQMQFFPMMSSKGVGIWILTAATEYEYNKLFMPANWYTYLGIMK